MEGDRKRKNKFRLSEYFKRRYRDEKLLRFFLVLVLVVLFDNSKEIRVDF